jgi:hypothetical protein
VSGNPKYRDLDAIVSAWQIRRLEIASKWQDGASGRSLNDFVATSNALSRRFLSEMMTQDPLWCSALAELATTAQNMIEGGKIFVDGKDRTDL